MARIVMADDGIAFDGVTFENAPLGGAETAFVSLAEAFARRGHAVEVRNRCRHPGRHNGVLWAPLERAMPAAADLYIANRGDKLLPLMPEARRTVFWIHNPARYLLKPRYMGIFEENDPARRLIVLANHNSDLAEYWEWSASGFFPVDITNEAYALGVNYIIYGLTH